MKKQNSENDQEYRNVSDEYVNFRSVLNKKKSDIRMVSFFYYVQMTFSEFNVQLFLIMLYSKQLFLSVLFLSRKKAS